MLQDDSKPNINKSNIYLKKLN